LGYQPQIPYYILWLSLAANSIYAALLYNCFYSFKDLV
jgi:hypothetical protein